jgi:DNA-binding transcriptional ArsR family regulator
MMNDSLYNPDSMSKEDIKTLFVARQPLLDELVSTIRNQPDGAGVQHLLIIAPRGMGKTTMLLMVQFAVEDNKDLAKNWQAVRFPEESYDVTELADFWLKVLDYLDDSSLKPKIEEIKKLFTNSEDLREAAWALVKDWSKKHKKRIVLLIDNFDMILDQIGNDTEQARLRDILMNDGTVMLIGCAPSYFHQIQDYGQPLYNFFKTFNLNDLKFPDIEELIRRRAEIDEIPNIEELLQKNRTRIKALEAFTGGNPRLVLMLYRIITSSDMTEVRNGLERLLDAVTPYYKDKTEKLPPQQRKIINEIAQYSLEKSEGISPTEIAQRIRMTPNQVSAQLKRLAENGYVKSLNIRGRSSFYVLSEPLYAIWAQMRFGRNAREKRNWLVQILKAIYDVQEIQREIEKLDERIKKFKLDGRENKAKGTLEYMLCLLETNPLIMEKNYELAVEGYLELKEITSLKSEISFEKLKFLSINIIQRLLDEKILKVGEIFGFIFENIRTSLKSLVGEIQKDIVEGNDLNNSLEKLDKVISALEEETNYNKTSEADELMSIYLITVCSVKASILMLNKTYDEASYLFDKIISIYDLKIAGKSEIYKIKEVKDIIANVYWGKVIITSLKNSVDEATITIDKYISLLKDFYQNEFLGIAFIEIFKVLKSFDNKTVNQIIQKSNFAEEFFPLITAINYLETKDETLIEKLSPEIRIVVEETIKTLQMIEDNKSNSKTNQKQKTKKDRASEKTLALSK